jgi:FixJ family two-component response regulator
MALGVKKDRVVFVVDDDEAVRDSICVLLQSEEIAARAFASAAELLSDKDAFSATCYVFDVHMPSMDGVELARRLRNESVAAPILLLTGRPDAALRRAAEGAGATAVLNKPNAELLDVIRGVS